VTSSNNPQVAQYNFTAPQGASVQVQFGTTTNYGLTTWAQEAPVTGGTVSILVAGMRANTTYHMQAVVRLPGGQRIVDADHFFTTGTLSASLVPKISIPQAAGVGAKINYQDGIGDGSILWHLGEGGDFAMTSGTAPLEWNYAQHYPTVLTPNSAGIFQLMVFNNGGGRLLDTNNDVCGTPGFAACYSSVPVYELNEFTNTAQVMSDDDLSPHYSLAAGTRRS
jgi:hypothetical protein